jgi:hypothetical protein
MTPIDREPPEQSPRDERIARQPSRHVRRKLGEFHGRRGQCVVARNRNIREHENKRRRNVVAGVLPCLGPKVPIERFDTTID